MFDGTNHASIALPTFIFHHTFAIHSWLYPFTNGSNRYVFSKDRNDFTSADTSKHFTFVIDTDNKPLINMAKDSDPTTTYNFKGDSTYDEDTWVYSIISVKMFYGFSTELSFYKNNYISGSMITGPIFMIDFAAYPAYVAAHRSGTSTWSSDYFEGYIYEFHIYNEEYSRGATHYLSTG